MDAINKTLTLRMGLVVTARILMMMFSAKYSDDLQTTCSWKAQASDPHNPLIVKGILAGKCTVSGENKHQTVKKPVELAATCGLNTKGTAYDFFTPMRFVHWKNHNQSGYWRGKQILNYAEFKLHQIQYRCDRERPIELCHEKLMDPPLLACP